MIHTFILFTLFLFRFSSLYFIFYYYKENRQGLILLCITIIGDIFHECFKNPFLYCCTFSVLECITILESYLFLFFYNISVLVHIISKLFTKEQEELKTFLNGLETVDDLEAECVICLENNQENSNLKYLYCSHIVHPKCLITWFQKQEKMGRNCPLCQQNIFDERLLI